LLLLLYQAPQLTQKLTLLRGLREGRKEGYL
jgi:hypothetical protein